MNYYTTTSFYLIEQKNQHLKEMAKDKTTA